VIITTTEFPVMELGRVWKQRFGVPFVLDFQDPWATFPATAAPYLRRGPKHRIMRFIHSRLEAWTLPAADGLMAVSQAYIDLFHDTYRVLRDRPAMVSPFPYSSADFSAAVERGRPVDGLASSGGTLSCLYAGRIAPAMEPSLRACLELAAAGRRLRPDVFDRLHFVFVGTGYAASGNPSVASRLATETGMSDRVVEHPDRIGFLDAQRSMVDADILLVLGSADDGYMPSKLNQSLSLAKPVLCAAPRTSPAAEALDGLTSVLNFDSGESISNARVDALANQLIRLLSASAGKDYAERETRIRAFEAAQAARQDCALFDRVVETVLQLEKDNRRHGQ